MTTRIAALLTLLALAAPAQDRPAAPPLPDAKEQLLPGLAMHVETAAGRDVRDVRLAAIYVPEGTPPTSFLSAGPFKAAWEGFISVDLGTDCTFSALGTGAVLVTINDKPALTAKGADLSGVEGPSLRLRKGRNRLVVKYESPGKGDAWIRLQWASSDFPKEPVPPSALSHDANAPALRARRRVREGRELFAMRRCAKCHATDLKGMPELEMDAPSLENAGGRLRADWMAPWIREPRALRPEATMPHLNLSAQESADVAAHLATLSAAPEVKPRLDTIAVKRGGHLFAELRCVGCHTLPDKDPAPDRIPLHHVASKRPLPALEDFLVSPEKHYAWIEMPNFRLSSEEASLLAQFLYVRPQKTLEPAKGGDSARGKQVIETRGCMNCHKIPGTNEFKAVALKDIPAEGWTRGCMAEKPAGKAPDFGFTPAQREALLAFAATDLSSLTREALPEFSERSIRNLRCFACHKRDDRVDAWSDLSAETKGLEPPKKAANEDVFEVEPSPPWFPSLTYTGEKLKPEWMAAFLKGEIKERPRPYLNALRMPAWPSRGERIADGIVQEHGCPPKSPAEPAPDAEMSGHGRKLSGTVPVGFDCLQCHGIGPRAATKVFEAPAPNFKFSKDRLRKDYFERWLREPLRLEPGTKMPQFFKEGRSQLTEVLDGDVAKQTEALWQYLLEGERIKPPSE